MRYLVILAFALLAFPATGAAAQNGGSCATMTQAQAQAALDAEPTYANRALFDPDGNGIACDHGAFAGGGTAAATTPEGCGGMTQTEAQALLDSEPTYANRALLDPDGNGIACDHGAEVVSALPSTGVGGTSALAWQALAAALALAGAGVALASRGRGRTGSR